MQQLLVFQSLWGMERLQGRTAELSLDQKLDLVAQAGFDGVSDHFYKASHAAMLMRKLDARGLRIEAQCFPTSIDDLQPVAELATRFNAHHITIQPDLRPRSFADSVRILEGWNRIAADCEIPVLVETHRGRMTNDLLLTLDLLDAVPDLRLLADLSHYVVAREIPVPDVPDETQRQIMQVLDRSWAIHGRIASPCQVQVELSFTQHRPLLECFAAWWQAMMAGWQRRAGEDDSLSFLCELGPHPYAIGGPDAQDLSDRWEEALLLRDLARQLWAEIS